MTMAMMVIVPPAAIVRVLLELACVLMSAAVIGIVTGTTASESSCLRGSSEREAIDVAGKTDRGGARSRGTEGGRISGGSRRRLPPSVMRSASGRRDGRSAIPAVRARRSSIWELHGGLALRGASPTGWSTGGGAEST